MYIYKHTHTHKRGKEIKWGEEIETYDLVKTMFYNNNNHSDNDVYIKMN